MKTKLVVFDMAGTTVEDNDNVHGALIGALAEFGVESDYEDANEVMGYPKPVAIRMILEKRLEDPLTINNTMVSDIHDEFVHRMVEHYRNSPDLREKPNASETFAALRSAGIKVAIDTGFSRPIAQAIFDRLEWLERGLVDFTVTSDEVAEGRPFPDMIFKSMEACGVADSENVCKVGDTASDMQQGTSAGCGMVVGVTTGAYTAEALAQEEHTHLIADLAELPEILEIHAIK